MSDDFNRMPEIYDQFKQLEKDRLTIGVPWTDQHLNMIALVQEYGKTIRPVNRQWLALPTPEAHGKHPKDFPNLFFVYQTPEKAYLAMKDPGKSVGIKTMFVLRKSVVIPPRPFIRNTFDHSLDAWTDYAGDLGFNLMMGDLSVDGFYTKLGDRIVDDLKKAIKAFDNPKNAALTVANKGFDDPLIQSGKLRDSIMWIKERN